MYHLKIGGQEIRLRYDLAAYEMIEQHKWPETDEETSCGYDRMVAAWNDPRTFATTCIDLVMIFGNNALEASGSEPVLTHEWLARKMTPGMLRRVKEALQLTMREGNNAQADEVDEDDHDVVLEELEAKKDEAGT